MQFTFNSFSKTSEWEKEQTIREGRADRRGPGYKNEQEVVLLLDYNYFFLVAKKKTKTMKKKKITGRLSDLITFFAVALYN